MIDKAQVRATLEERKKVLLQRIEEIDEDIKEHEEENVYERATEIASDDVLEKLEAAGIREVEQIRAALARLDEGTYGECANCGADIGEPRLAAVPYATKCISCASEES